MKDRILHYTKEHFTWVIAFVCLSLFSFNFWLFYPGYLTHDYVGVITNFTLNNWQPVIYSVLLKKLFFLFGNHFYFLLLFNLVPFYFGLYILTLGFWKKFHSQWCWLGLLPICIGNIYFNNIVMHCSFSSPMFVFLLWTIVLYQILVGITYKNSILLLISFVFALLSRHNAIIQVYPIFFVYSWLIVQRMRNSSKLYKANMYIGFMSLFAIFSLLIVIKIPNFLKEGRSVYPSSHVFLHQIAGICIPNHDASCFKKEWYDDGKTYADVIKTYNEFPLNADRMNREWYQNHPFKNIYTKLEGLPEMWLKSVRKYPIDYLKYINNFRKEMWHTNAFHYDLSIERKNHCLAPKDCDVLEKLYSKDLLFYEVSSTKIRIYDLFKRIFPEIPTIIFVLLNFIFFAISCILFIKKKDLLSLYVLSSSIAGIASSIIFSVFAPIITPRYIYPVLISTLMCTIGIIVYFCNKVPVLNVKITSTNIKENIKKYRKYMAIVGIIMIIFAGYIYINKPLKTRIDISSKYADNPTFIVHQDDILHPIKEAAWMPKIGNRGVVVQENGHKTTFVITALQDADITIALRGPDERDTKGKRIEKWVEYTSFKINDKPVIPDHQTVWHDKPFKYTLKAKKNNAYKVELKWRKK